ncbi:hypothetical protein [Desertivirga brevis]|uniref:hypothetical protein n=1 Tax=Desertivirga brevis TaxID=2810310 RepID=UPI001A95CAD6|nr:hypothetical protein [Pedobacter sp. SYSU D00873]
MPIRLPPFLWIFDGRVLPHRRHDRHGNLSMTELLNNGKTSVNGEFFPEVAKKYLGTESFYSLSGLEMPDAINVQVGQNSSKPTIFTVQCYRDQETNEPIFTLLSKQKTT